jgi:hypothetical protein
MAPLEALSRSVKQLIPSSVKSRLRTLIGKPAATKPRTWVARPESLPWFDRPDALGLLATRRQSEHLSDLDYQRLREWATTGHFAVTGLVGPDLIDGMMRELDGLWTTDTPREGLDIEGLKLTPEAPAVRVSHRDVCALAPSVRIAARDRSNWRVVGFHRVSDNARRIFVDPELARLASLIFGTRAAPSYALNFMYGSTQTEHQDSAVFHVFPPNYIAGAWIACEDISPDSGPLMYYPGSHREPMFHEFTNYPQTSLKTASPDVMQAYNEYAVALARKYERRLFVAKKGDVLFWHGMVLHGGSEVRNPSLTRRSFVIHYVPPGMDVSDQIVGPFNW